MSAGGWSSVTCCAPPSFSSFYLAPLHRSSPHPPHKRPQLPHNKLDSHRSPSICVTPGIPWTKMLLPNHPQHICIIKAIKTATVFVAGAKHSKKKKKGRQSREEDDQKERWMINGSHYKCHCCHTFLSVGTLVIWLLSKRFCHHSP